MIDSLNIKDLAFQKSKEIASFEHEWTRALKWAQVTLSQSVLSEEGFKQLVLASNKPEKFTLLIRLIYSYSKQNPHREPAPAKLQCLVDSTSFTMSDWVDAIFYFHHWLENNHRKINFLSMLNYLECCSNSPDANEPGQTLESLLRDMLNLFDYKG